MMEWNAECAANRDTRDHIASGDIEGTHRRNVNGKLSKKVGTILLYTLHKY